MVQVTSREPAGGAAPVPRAGAMYTGLFQRIARRATVSIVAVLLLSAAPARAQEAPADAAAARYEEALVDLDEGRYDAACPKLEAVIAATPDKLIAHHKLGGCYLAQGKLASAWARFVFVRDRARQAGSVPQAQVAEESARQLEKKLATLTVVVPPEVARTPGLAVVFDGAPMEPASFGKPRPVDRGAHHIEASAPGGIAWRKVVVVSEDGKSFSVAVPSLGGARPAPEPSSGPPPAPRPWQRPAAMVVAGLGVAGLAAGAGTFALAVQKRDESLLDCRPDNHCNDIGYRVRNEARGLGDGATAALVAGGLLLSAGVVLFFTAPRRSEGGARAPVHARVELGLGHMTVTGSW